MREPDAEAAALVRRQLDRHRHVAAAAAAAAPQAPGGGRGGAAPVSTADFRPILKSEMRALDADLVIAIAKTSDRMSKAHLEDARDQIANMLDPKR